MSWLFGAENESDNSSETGSTAQPTGDLADQASNLLGSFMTLAASVGEAVKETTEKVADVALSDFQKEQKKFVQSKKVGGGGTSLPPWIGYDNEDDLKEKILALSKDERNFLRDPPSGQSAFSFDMDKMAACAMATLNEDKSLDKMRAKLVPKTLSEEKFWQNYFYRVSLIQSSSEVSAMASESMPAIDEPAPVEHGLDAVPPSSSLKTEPHGQDVDESTLNEVNDSLQMNEIQEDEDMANQLTEPSHVNLSELGDGLSDSTVPNAETYSPSEPDEIVTTEDGGKPSDSDGVTTDTSATWEKDLDAELEDFSEFENLNGGGADEELEAGWEDEVAQMLEEEDAESDD